MSSFDPLSRILHASAGKVPDGGSATGGGGAESGLQPALIADDRHSLHPSGQAGGERKLGAERGGFQEADPFDHDQEPERAVSSGELLGAARDGGRLEPSSPASRQAEREDRPRALLHDLDDRQAEA
jgi:hypothetical protein